MRSSKKKPRTHNTEAKTYVDKIIALIDIDAEQAEYRGFEVDGLKLDFYENNIEAASFRLYRNSVCFYKNPNMDGQYDEYGFETKAETFDYAFKLNNEYVADCDMEKLYNMVEAEYGAKIKAAKKGLGRAIDKKYKSSK